MTDSVDVDTLIVFNRDGHFYLLGPIEGSLLYFLDSGKSIIIITKYVAYHLFQIILTNLDFFSVVFKFTRSARYDLGNYLILY